MKSKLRREKINIKALIFESASVVFESFSLAGLCKRRIKFGDMCVSVTILPENRIK